MTDQVKSESLEPSKAFTGGDQGFIDLKLAEVSNINHNVKRFRFELPQKDAVSGLTIACESHGNRFGLKKYSQLEF